MQGWMVTWSLPGTEWHYNSAVCINFVAQVHLFPPLSPLLLCSSHFQHSLEAAWPLLSGQLLLAWWQANDLESCP